MPSNAMKGSQLAAKLTELVGQHDDLDCVFVSGGVIAIDGRNIMVTNEIGGQRLPRPVIAIGVTVDDEGRRRSAPGEPYQKTVTADEWNYSRADAPEDTPLIVWKRIGGRDRGYRQGERWFVYEGNDWPVEIIPAGVLGWRLEE